MSHFYAGAIALVIASKRIEILLLGARRPVACMHELSCRCQFRGLARSQMVKNAQDDAVVGKQEDLRPFCVCICAKMSTASVNTICQGSLTAAQGFRI